MTVSAGSEGWVERYRRMGYRRFYEHDSPEIKPYEHVTIAYGEPDQEAPWLAAGRISAPRINCENGDITMDFMLSTYSMTHSFDFDVNEVEVLWKGL